MFCLVAMNSPAIQAVLLNTTLLIGVIIVYISSICALIVCRLDTKVPVNYILLAIFTYCCSWIVAVTCIRYDQIVVFEAASLTASIVIALTFYAITTKNDFTICGPIMFILGMLFMVGSMLALVFGPNMRLLWCIIGVFLFSFYLIIDTQMIVGGSKRHYHLTEDHYILASLMLYLDIINIFLEILKILGNK